jgi:hypothetical protein
MWDEGIRNNSEGAHNKISTERDKTLFKATNVSSLLRRGWIFHLLRHGWQPFFSLKSKQVRPKRAICRLSPLLLCLLS